MARKNADLHGAAPHSSRVALVLIDVINAMRFPTGDLLARQALPAARAIVAMKKRAAAAGVPVIYANDNYGRWRSDFRATLAHARAPDAPGRKVAALLAPANEDYFVLKPKHSAFYASSLELLLSYVGAECIVLAGFAGDICVRFTAQDAFLRDYELVVASDGTASEDPRSNKAALAYMRDTLGATIKPAKRIDFRRLSRR
ncbi:MAG: isochorismatase family cysteine hydrolase [Kofleriaceae bacterium]|nr:isochorismatase family cysteine hydrolase [Kofleriaceae bacterium]